MGTYNFATICLNGHVVSDIYYEYTRYCDKCGKKTISLCQNCNADIRGALEDEFSIEINYHAPAYCHNCGHPFPWTEQLIENAIEIISLDDRLSNEEKDILKNALPDLVVETPSSPVATVKFKKYMQNALDYTKTGLKNLLIDVVSETIKKSIWG